MNDTHALDIQTIFDALSSSKKGLSNIEAKKRIEQYGENVLPDGSKTSIFRIIFNNANNILTYVLAGAALISYVLGHQIDTYVILTVLIINVAIATRHELKAANTINGLKSLAAPKCVALRNGHITKLNASELVPGDIVLLKEGDKVPADCRIVSSKNLAVIESSLTGEAKAVNKMEGILEKETMLGDRFNIVHMGTIVTAGEARAIVVETGLGTEIGKIARNISEIKEEKTLFDIRTEKLMQTMIIIALSTAALTFIIGLIRRLEISELFLFTTASLVSAIPEGLPAVLTIALSIAAYRMGLRKAVVRNLSSIETLSSVTTIVTDKTGTLTKNTMTVERLYLPDGRKYEITGKDWTPKGKFLLQGNEINPQKDETLSILLPFLSVVNNSRLLKGKTYSIIGDPTEASRLVLARKAGYVQKKLLKERYKILDEIPYGQDTKYRGAIVRDMLQKKNFLIIVGASEKVVAKSKNTVFGNLDIQKKKEINQIINLWTKEAMRVQALAFKETIKESFDDEKIENLTLGCILGILDPVRDDVYEAVLKAKNAGIRVIMATGDHKETALSIARKVGIIDENTTGILAYSEDEVCNMSEREFKKAVKEVSVFSRLTPSTKLRIAETLQSTGEIIAMTGDGVNDAMAIKKANIGISMGNIGTDAAREASDIVIMDDNFATIVNAIEEGLTVFRNIKQTSTYLVTTNLSEDFFIIIALIIGTPLPLLPIQILWLNLLTDGLLDVSLAMEKPGKDVWVQGIVNKKANIISKETFPLIVINILTMGVIALITFNAILPEGLDKARTSVFIVMTFSQIFFAFNMRSMRYSLFKIGIFTNKYVFFAGFISIILGILLIEIPFLADIFRFDNLVTLDFAKLFVLSLLVLVVGEIYKLFMNKYRGDRT